MYNRLFSMKNNECERCCRVFDTKPHLIQHLKRKLPCEPLRSDIEPVILIEKLTRKEYDEKHIYCCDYCNLRFMTSSGKRKHMDGCSSRLQSFLDNKIKESQIVKSMQEEISNLKQQLNDHQYINNVTTNNIVNNNIQNNIVVNLKDFYVDYVPHIEMDKDFLETCLMNKDITKLIENIHCDKDHPEYHNVRIKSTKNSFMEVYADGKWIVTDSEETLDDLVKKGYRVLKRYSHKNKNHLKKRCEDDGEEYSDLMDWLEDIYDNNKVNKPLKKQLLLLFINNRVMLLGKD